QLEEVLPCQHTFCRRCLENIVSSRNELRCPECRILVDCGVDDLPANILCILLSIDCFAEFSLVLPVIDNLGITGCLSCVALSHN
uniref:RING-type domain-containing protein n=1 Tax=Cyclopterus lumpus TaxID=8103 RepID=A0A8C3B2L1_CYCLU